MLKPQICPNFLCECHDGPPEDLKKSWYILFGCYETKAFGTVQRYRCKKCYKSFSDQTLKMSYYSKKKLNPIKLLTLLSSAVNNRALSRYFKVSPGTVENNINRMARQVLSVQAEINPLINLSENLSADGFESFCVSQYFPNNIHLLAGSDSQYVYFQNYVLMRRKGRMTDKQKDRRKELYEDIDFGKKAIEKSFSQVVSHMEMLVEKRTGENPVTLFTDKKQDYPRAVKKNSFFKELTEKQLFVHTRIDSKRFRNKKNPLFPVNYMDRQIRKDQSGHVRETCCHSRNVNNMLNRLVLYIFHHNYYKSWRIGQTKYKNVRHAHKAGLAPKVVKKKISGIFKKRKFLTLSENLDTFSRELWERNFLTPGKRREEYKPNYIWA